MRSFDLFVQLPENRSAYQAVLRLAATSKGPLLFLHGPPGSGKSLLMQSLVEEISQARSAKTAQVLAAAEVGRALLQPPLERQPVSREAINCDLLVIEDLQHLPSAAGDEVAHILDRRHARRRPTVVTAIRGPALLKTSPRLASRLVGGLVIGIRPLGEASRLELAASLCRERNLAATDDVIAWLARDPGGARPMIGGIAQLEALSRVHAPPLTMAHVTAELPANPLAESSPLDRLVASVATRFKVDVKAIRGSSRQRHIVWPRQVAMYIARQTGWSFPQIGQFFGGRDHTTVIHSCAKVTKAMAENPGLALELRDLVATAK